MYNSVMEIANSRARAIRLATGDDRGDIFRLLREAAFVHVHSDWYLPSDWLGTPAFVISERVFSSNSSPEILGCMAAASDPLPAAWMRIVALKNIVSPEETLTEMFQAILPKLRSQGANQLAWLPGRYWPEQWLKMLGFEKKNWITTFIKEDLEIPQRSDRNVTIRPVMSNDFPELAKLEEDAFEPLWRHSANGLRLAKHQAISFLVALIEGQLVGFQYSVRGQQPDSAHLVRITVDRQRQSQGIGTALMEATLDDYRRAGAAYVSLNTQVDNFPSHHLYKRFGFRQIDDNFPLWIMKI